MADDTFRLIVSGTRTYRVRQTGFLSSSLEAATHYSKFHHNEAHQTVELHHTGALAKRSITVPHQLHHYIIGRGGDTLRRLMAETNTRITIPSRSKHGGGRDEILIESAIGAGQAGGEGSDAAVSLAESAVLEAETRIGQIVAENLHKVPYTHFISIPISDSSIQRRVRSLQTEIQAMHKQRAASTASKSETSDSQNVSAVMANCIMSPQNPGSLHLTLGMLRLLNQKEVENAVRVLKSLSQEIYDMVGTRSLRATLRGVKVMGNDPKKCRILYIGVEDNEKLREVCEFIRKRFQEEGLLQIDEKEEAELLLHMTILRVHLNGDGSDRNHGKKQGGFIDATNICQQFDDTKMGEFRIGQVQIARRFKFTDDGAFHSEEAVAMYYKQNCLCYDDGKEYY
ncbi:activating signal cointegrator 1 complex subunit [Spiromyces aspiralis]|uniref:Activating signal cointegrator 1 complex subunit n=1 Tax=Spiromyces aspiralis TaxID=68401 RepID=A0ACC1HUN3_9FUNG|nr:activating signal cointegrator 1 complex subunit [Spiromyces aspiralis]